MSQEIISKQAEIDLEILKKTGLLSGFYLVGGTGLVFQLKHRLSLDLDFFTKKDVDAKLLISKLKRLGKLFVQKEDEDTLNCVFNETRLTFLRYDYPLLFKLKMLRGIKVADFRDIGCMKLDAISSRGTKKDFIDLYFICRKVNLINLLELFAKKYKSINYNMMHVLKSLVYFNDAENEPMPKMIIPVKWDKIKEFLKSEVRKIKI